MTGGLHPYTVQIARLPPVAEVAAGPSTVLVVQTPLARQRIDIVDRGPQGPQGPPGASFRSYTFAMSLEWRVKHGMGVDVFCESLVDSIGNRFYARLRIVSLDEFVIDLTERTAGTIHVFFKTIHDNYLR